MTRIVIAGMGDTGVLSAIELRRRLPDADIVGIATKPGLVSGQELGLRLARPDRWSRDYRIAFEDFRGLDGVRIARGAVESVDLVRKQVVVDESALAFDVLVVATGVRNGFWRQPKVQTAEQVVADLAAAHAQLRAAGSVIVVGGGAAAVASAAQLAAAYPSTRVDLFFPGDAALPQHHRAVWPRVRQRLERLGVGLHPGHRAVVADGFAGERITTEPVAWTTGQPDSHGDAVLWAIGRVRPNTAFLPGEVLDEHGFVQVGPDLRVAGTDGVFAIGDVAATDPLRTSARNWGHRTLGHNVAAHLAGTALKDYVPPRRRWGSVLGLQADGLVVHLANGRAFRVPLWAVDRILQPWITDRGIYRGIRR
ncbi:FAD-dependent oxidoreductase [Nocardioides sp.]|uniref:FAD-dependent oxidoreductase n=1 Tax=Nocardioides sp. TaxID=35761 RepID=UPI00286D83A7|nr:FAD-dependent oxidoreductase [Nocardioides sp.]